MDVIYVKQALILKEAKKLYKKLATDKDPMKSLYMIDIIQRLSIEHHFAEEIEEALEKQHIVLSSNINSIDFVNSHELYDVALAFRLLRQGGHYVKPDLFDSLMCNKRNTIREKFGEDVKGLIAMYEASQLSIEGEDHLNDIRHLSSELLHEWLSRHQNHSEAIYVTNILQYPLHYGLSRFMDKTKFLTDLKVNNEWTCLEELAKINVSILRWWKDLGMAKETMFAQYQPLKWYLWPMACFTDPSFSEERIELTKVISLIYVIDDIFDVHGTIEQLTLFTDLATRWTLTGAEELPDFMKICLSFIYKITNDFAEKVYKKHGLNPIDTLKKSWILYLNSVLKEAHWLNSGHLPKANEYLNNGIVSPGVHLVLIHAFFLFDHIQDITKETIAILDDDFPNIMYSVAKILRLSDDLEGDKNGDQNGLDGSYLDCYMNEHKDISAEEAQRHNQYRLRLEKEIGFNAELNLIKQLVIRNEFTED
ncbi:hypothetical protein TSUD_388190 [Trifolium subterraneum]|uniref:Terpene synthase metal-binding domain-containing protein n=1 Tax=Trifolium subterraneum TaxID=3900 RepID=A0A2Z6MQD3_TRISU|nr:hypothetical protein TSUD_388190 [Trifolium subterraneum]